MSDIPITVGDAAGYLADAISSSTPNQGDSINNWNDKASLIMTNTSKPYQFYVDWEGNGSYAELIDDITDYVIEAEWGLGRDYASELSGLSSAGRCRLELINTDGRFNRFNTNSPLYGYLLPGRKMRIIIRTDSGDTTVWRGFLDTITPDPNVHRAHRAELLATGPLGFISETDVDIGLQSSILTGSAISLILDQANWPTADRLIDNGLITMSDWFPDNVNILTALRDVEGSEGGFIRESKDGKIIFEQRDARDAKSSIVTMSDANGATYAYVDIEQHDPIKEIYNVVEIELKTFEMGDLAVIYETSCLGPIEWSYEPDGWENWNWATFILSTSSPIHTWVLPDPQDDYEMGYSCSSTQPAYAVWYGSRRWGSVGTTTAELQFAWHPAVTASGYVADIAVSGYPLVESDPVILTVEDADSIEAYGRRVWPVNAPFLPDQDTANTYLNYILAKYKDPYPILTIEFDAKRNTSLLDLARTVDLSDKITVISNPTTKLGINDDFFVERISQRVSHGNKEHIVRIECSNVRS
jgi:hypothetical protein